MKLIVITVLTIILSWVTIGFWNILEGSSVGNTGPICNGIADDTAAIQKAVNASPTVLLPAGTCSITTLTIDKSNVSITGVGNSATTLKARSGATILLNLGTTTPVARVSIKQMLIDCNNISGVTGIQADSPARQTNSLYLEDLQIDNCPGGALVYKGVGNSWASNIIGSNNGASDVPAIVLQRGASGVTSNNNKFYGLDLEKSRYAGILLAPGADLNFFESTIIDDAGVAGIIVQGSHNVFQGLGGILGNNGDFILFPTAPGALGRMNSFSAVEFDYDPSVTSGTVINLANLAGAAGFNSFIGVAIRTLPAGTTGVKDTMANGNFFSNIRTLPNQAGTLLTITNAASVVIN